MVIESRQARPIIMLLERQIFATDQRILISIRNDIGIGAAT